MTIRGTGIQASAASSYTVPWPSGTLAGDFAIIMVGHGYAPNAISGWTSNITTAANWQGAVYYKTLTAADITAGSVTVTFSNSYDGVLAILTVLPVAGTYSTTAHVDTSQNTSGSSSVVLTTTAMAATANLLAYFGSNRAVSVNTVSSGTLQQTMNDGANASGALYTETGVSGILSRTFSYSVPGVGNYQAIAILGTVNVVGPNNGTPITNANSGVRHQLVKGPASIASTPSGLNPVPVATQIQGGVVGGSYSETITTSGGIAPYTYTLASGTLPPGTTLSSAGVISGIPTTAGTYTFSIKTTDSAANTGTSNFTATIVAALASNYGYVA